MKFASAYGLSISSVVPLPDFTSVDAEIPDVVVRHGRLDHPEWEDETGELQYAVRPGGIILYWPRVGTIDVRHGQEIVVDLFPNADPRHVALFLSGPGLNALLHQRGLVVLHASGVEVDGGCVGFLGGSGWGKSTIASAMLKRGHRLVADDGIALSEVGFDPPMVLPSFPAMKLWPGSLSEGERGDLPRVLPEAEKRLLKIDEGFVPTTIPLRALYLLGVADQVHIEPIGSRDAVIELVRHSSRIQMLHSIDPARHFARCSQLAAKIVVKRLLRPMDFSRLDALLLALEDDLSAS
jgi:hypothetical protein